MWKDSANQVKLRRCVQRVQYDSRITMDGYCCKSYDQRGLGLRCERHRLAKDFARVLFGLLQWMRAQRISHQTDTQVKRQTVRWIGMHRDNRGKESKRAWSACYKTRLAVPEDRKALRVVSVCCRVASRKLSASTFLEECAQRYASVFARIAAATFQFRHVLLYGRILCFAFLQHGVHCVRT